MIECNNFKARAKLEKTAIFFFLFVYLYTLNFYIYYTYFNLSSLMACTHADYYTVYAYNFHMQVIHIFICE